MKNEDFEIVTVELTEYLIQSDFAVGNGLPMPASTKQTMIDGIRAGKRYSISYPVPKRK